MQTNLYYINSYLIGQKPMLVTKKQLPKLFANKAFSESYTTNYWEKLENDDLTLVGKKYATWHVFLKIVEFTNLTNYYFKKTIWRFGSDYDLIGEYDHKRDLSQGELIKLVLMGKQYYQALQQREKWSGQANYLATSNLLGNTLNVPIKIVNAMPRKGDDYYRKPHTATGFKHSRVKHTMSVFARDNYTKIRHWDYEDLMLHPNQIKHYNRSYRRTHLNNFPMFDDDEYIKDRHSTGWKYSTKCSKQYLI